MNAELGRLTHRELKRIAGMLERVHRTIEDAALEGHVADARKALGAAGRRAALIYKDADLRSAVQQDIGLEAGDDSEE